MNILSVYECKENTLHTIYITILDTICLPFCGNLKDKLRNEKEKTYDPISAKTILTHPILCTDAAREALLFLHHESYKITKM